jgi:hypothetical protein
MLVAFSFCRGEPILASVRPFDLRCMLSFRLRERLMGEQSDNEQQGSVWWPRLVSALLGIIVTVVGAVVVQKLESREPRLTYSSVETVPFSGPSSVVGIYQVVLHNDGKSEVEAINCYVRIPGAKVEQYRTIAAPSLSTTATVVGDAVRVDIPSLNPGETAQVSILATSPTYLPNHPEISLRAKGVTGEEQPATGAPQRGRTEPYLSLAATIAATSALVSTALIRLLLSRKGFGNQSKTLASVCEMHGLKIRADRYGATKGITYYAEADRLGDEADRSASAQVVSEVKKILLALSGVDTVKRESRAIILYNLARISAKEGNADEADNYLAQATKLSSEEIEGRRRIDPLFSGAVARPPDQGTAEKRG